MQTDVLFFPISQPTAIYALFYLPNYGDFHLSLSSSNMLRPLILILLSTHLALPVLASLKDLSHCDPLKKDARS